MRVLVTGNQGYIGSVLSPMLQNDGHTVVGLDAGYFSDCLIDEVLENFEQIKKDIRDIQPQDLDGIDSIIHLAGLSNDPLGDISPALTHKINFEGTVNLARIAKKVGVKRFVFASSQSMYGVSDTSFELEEDVSDINPLTAYAQSKWEAEVELKKLVSDNFLVVCFRPSTVFGASPRLRNDIVFNNLVAGAYTTQKIEVKSDGSPWRPVVHVRDVCAAFISGLYAPAAIINGRSFNVGIADGNFTVRDLAEVVQRTVPGSSLNFTAEHGNDSRTYRVSFRRILSDLIDYYKPSWSLEDGGQELVSMFEKVDLNETQFRGRHTIRLAQLRYLMDSNQLDHNLRWKTE